MSKADFVECNIMFSLRDKQKSSHSNFRFPFFNNNNSYLLIPTSPYKCFDDGNCKDEHQEFLKTPFEFLLECIPSPLSEDCSVHPCTYNMVDDGLKKEMLVPTFFNYFFITFSNLIRESIVFSPDLSLPSSTTPLTNNITIQYIVYDYPSNYNCNHLVTVTQKTKVSKCNHFKQLIFKLYDKLVTKM